MEVRLRADPRSLLLASPSCYSSRIRQLPASTSRCFLGCPTARPCFRSKKGRRKLSRNRPVAPLCSLPDDFGANALLAAAAAAATFSVVRLVYLSQSRRDNQDSKNSIPSKFNASTRLPLEHQNEDIKATVQGYDSLPLEDAYNHGYETNNRVLQIVPGDGSDIKENFTCIPEEEGNILKIQESTTSDEVNRPVFEISPLKVVDNVHMEAVGMTSIVETVAIPFSEKIDIIKELLLDISEDAPGISPFPEKIVGFPARIFDSPVDDMLRETHTDSWEMQNAASVFGGVSQLASSATPCLETVQSPSAVSGVASQLHTKPEMRFFGEISKKFTLQTNTCAMSQKQPLKKSPSLTSGFQLAEDRPKKAIPHAAFRRDIKADDNYRVNTKRSSRVTGKSKHLLKSKGDIKNSQTGKLHLKNANDPSSWLSHYNLLLKGARLKDCVDFLEDTERMGLLDMNTVYHTRFFKICKTQKAVKEALRFAKLIKNPTLSTFNMLLSVCASSQDYDGAVQVLLLVKYAGLRPDCHLYTTLISTCGKSGKVDAMFEVFHEMVNAGVEPNIHTYGALIDGCARAGQVAKAFGAYGIMRSKNVKPDRVIFNALITACGQSGAVDRAFDVLAEMLAEPQPIEPDHVTVGALIKTCIQAGQADRAREVYKMLNRYKIKGTPDVYTIAVNSCSLTGDLEFALSIYSDMQRNGINPDEMFLSSVIDVAGHAGRVDVAFAILYDAKRRGLQLGNVSYSSLMGACSKAKDWEKALELYEEIKAIKLCPTVSTMNALITSLCEGDQLVKAIDILHEMKDAGISPNTITYSILVVACEKKDELELGFDLFSQMEEDGVLPNLIMCQCLTGLCLHKYEKAYSLGEPILSFNSGRPTIDCKWTTLAMKVYRQTISAGVIPSSEVFSNVLGCLKFPNDTSIKNKFVENLGVMGENTRHSKLYSLLDGFGEYDPRAFSIFEEASSLGVVPSISLNDGPIVVDARNLQFHTAEVYLLTVLKGLKHRLAAGTKLPNITILLPIEKKQILSTGQEKMINISGRVGQAVAALLRRLKVVSQGDVSYGKIRVNGLSLRRWFKPKFTFPSYGVKLASLASSQSRLAKEIINQQRSIRSSNLGL